MECEYGNEFFQHEGITSLIGCEIFKIYFFSGTHITFQVPEPSLTFQNGTPAYSNYMNPIYDKSGHIIPGRKKSSNNKAPVFIKKYLAEYPIPERLQNIMLQDGEAAELLDQFPYLGEELCYENYKDKFSNLLHLEEIEQGEQMTRFSMAEVAFCPQGQYLSLDVPGLAEKRPSLALGDTAIASLSGDPNAQAYEGCIHDVRSKSVLLLFDQKFHQGYCGEIYDIEFKFSRGQFKKMHQAIDEVLKHFGSQVLFPQEIQAKSPQVSFVEENENPTLNYKVFPSKNRQFRHKAKKKCQKSDQKKLTTEDDDEYDPDIVIEKVELIPAEKFIKPKIENFNNSRPSPVHSPVIVPRHSPNTVSLCNTPSPTNESQKVRKRKTTIESLFPDKMVLRDKVIIPDKIVQESSEWMTPKLPLTGKLPDFTKKSFKHQFKLHDKSQPIHNG